MILHLRKYRKKVSWLLPGGMKKRVAYKLIYDFYREDKSSEDYMMTWAAEKDLLKSHIIPEVRILTKLLDKTVRDKSSDPVNSSEVERICRRLYSYIQAFKLVKCSDDWRRPRGEGARGWKTKVRWALCDAIDMGKLEDESGSIPGVDEETTARLKRLANFSKNLPAAGGADDMDVAQ